MNYEIDLPGVVDSQMKHVPGVAALGLPARDLGLRTRYGVRLPSVTLHVADVYEYFHKMGVSGGPTDRWQESVRVFQPPPAEFSTVAKGFFPGAAGRDYREGMVRRLHDDARRPARTVTIAADAANGRPMAMMMHDRALAVKDGVVTLFKKVRDFASGDPNFEAALEVAFCVQHAAELIFVNRAMADLEIDLPLEVAIVVEHGCSAPLDRFAELDRAAKASLPGIAGEENTLLSTLAFVP